MRAKKPGGWIVADLGEALYATIARSRSGSRMSMGTEPGSFAGALRFFMKAAGGNVSAAARLAGVPRRSLRDWLDGKSRPGRERQGRILDSARMSSRRERLTPRREARVRASDAHVVIRGGYNYDGPGDRAPINIGDYLEPGTMDRVVDAYLDGADVDELRETFAGGLTDAFYADTMILPQTDEHGWTVTRVDY